METKPRERLHGVAARVEASDPPEFVVGTPKVGGEGNVSNSIRVGVITGATVISS